MGEKTHIDDFVRASLAERSHAFNPAHWEQAEALILSQQRQKKRRFLLWFWFGMGALPVLLMGMGVLIYPYWNLNQGHRTHLATSISPVHKDSIERDYKLTTLEKLPKAENPSPKNKQKVKVQVPAHNLNRLKPVKSNQKGRNSTLPKILAKRGNSDKKTKESQGNPPLNGEEDSENPKDLPPNYRKGVLAAVMGMDTEGAEIPTFLAYEGVGINYHQSLIRHRIRLNYGGQFSPDFGSNYSKFNLNPILGATYVYQIKPGIGLNLGVQYAGRAGLNSDSIFTRRDFGFGAEEERVLRSPSQAHLIEVPFGLDIRLKNRHYLTISGFTSFLLDVAGKESSTLVAGSEEVPTGEERYFGMRQGFRRLDLGAQVGYKAYLGKGTFVGASLVMGSRDWTDETFFQQQRTDRHLGLRLSVSHDLWRR
ncbi:MAG: hypothetical protein MRZ79_17750 [Bacteroidia bacterium]|nr:hypothetical protein [Bacteroidia bacterium]